MARGDNKAGGGFLGMFKPGGGGGAQTVFETQRFASGSNHMPVVSASQVSFGEAFVARAQQVPAGKADFSSGSMVGNGLAKIPVNLAAIKGTLFQVFTGARVKGAFRRSA